MCILKVDKVTKRYEKTVLDAVSFTINENEKIALLGRNGAGKSTLIKSILGLVDIDGGKILKSIKKEDINVMLQEDNLLGSLKVIEQIKICSYMHKSRDFQRLENMYKLFSMEQVKDKFISELSGGQRRKVSLLLSLIGNPKLLILDEPTTGMDLESIDNLWIVLKKICGAILVVTHDFNQIDNHFDRIIILDKGKIMSDSSVEDIHNQGFSVEDWYRKLLDKEGDEA